MNPTSALGFWRGGKEILQDSAHLCLPPGAAAVLLRLPLAAAALMPALVPPLLPARQQAMQLSSAPMP